MDLKEKKRKPIEDKPPKLVPIVKEKLMASAIASGGVEVRMQKFFSFVVFIQFNKINSNSKHF